MGVQVLERSLVFLMTEGDRYVGQKAESVECSQRSSDAADPGSWILDLEPRPQT